MSSDFRDLEKAAEEGNERAKLAIDMFCYKVTKRIASASAAMGGVDAVVFTARVGENSAELREPRSCPAWALWASRSILKRTRFAARRPISPLPTPTVHTLLIPTNEELVIARDTKEIVEGMQK